MAPFFAIPVAIVAAVYTYKDARSLQQRGAGITPGLWAMLVFATLGIAFPFYFLIRWAVWHKQASPDSMDESLYADKSRNAEYGVACSCGNVVSVSETLAGNSTTCRCGATIAVPALRVLRGQSQVESASTAFEGPAIPDSIEVIAPTRVEIQGAPDYLNKPMMIALTRDVIGIQDTWQLRAIPLREARVERLGSGDQLSLSVGTEAAAERMTVTFIDSEQAGRWLDQIQTGQQQLASDVIRVKESDPGGVALVQHAPELPSEDLGRVFYSAPDTWTADRGLQLRAGLLGANAVIEVRRHQGLAGGTKVCHVAGEAVRAPDAESEKKLRKVWYSEELRSLLQRMLAIVLVYVGLLFVCNVLLSNATGIDRPAGKVTMADVKSGVVELGLYYAWPLVLLALLNWLQWPQLLRIVGLVVAAVVAGHEITVWAAHLFAMWKTGVGLVEGKLWFMLDPFAWAFVIISIVLCVRAWRLASNARQMLPREMQVASPSRAAWSYGLLGVSCIAVLAFLWTCSSARYETSSYVLQPGVDPRRELEAERSLDESLAKMDKDDQVAAEQSLQRTLALWEQLTAQPKVPVEYQSKLMCVLNNIGVTRERQNRPADAEEVYLRAIAVGDRVTAGRDNEYFQLVSKFARDRLAAVREAKAEQALADKSRASIRKFEEGQVAAHKDPVEAERLYRESIALQEEVLSQAGNEEYRKSAISQLTVAHLLLGEMQQRLDKRAGAEANYRKALEHAEKAVALTPDRPLLKLRVDIARQSLEQVRELALQDEITKLASAQRYADVIELFKQKIKDQEEQVRSGKDRDAARQRLGSRLDRLAWFLAHCPDEKVRDTKAAVVNARRATEVQPEVGEYWYSLSMVQYRNGDYSDSLASLEKVKAIANGFGAVDWYLSAMNLHQLKRTDEAAAAFRKGDDWLAEQRRLADDNAMLRIQMEISKPAFEALRREAQTLLEGKAAA